MVVKTQDVSAPATETSVSGTETSSGVNAVGLGIGLTFAVLTVMAVLAVWMVIRRRRRGGSSSAPPPAPVDQPPPYTPDGGAHTPDGGAHAPDGGGLSWPTGRAHADRGLYLKP